MTGKSILPHKQINKLPYTDPNIHLLVYAHMLTNMHIYISTHIYKIM